MLINKLFEQIVSKIPIPFPTLINSNLSVNHDNMHNWEENSMACDNSINSSHKGPSPSKGIWIGK